MEGTSRPERLLSSTMLITEPNRFVAEVDDRKPLILRPEQFDAWLDGSMSVDDMKTPIADDYCADATWVDA